MNQSALKPWHIWTALALLAAIAKLDFLTFVFGVVAAWLWFCSFMD